MSYSLATPCTNFPSTIDKPEGQGDCIKKDTCADRHVIQAGINAIHCMGAPHQGGGTIRLDCCNKQVASKE